MSLWILWPLLLAIALALVDDQPYCAVRYRRLCQGKGRHVACEFPDPGPGASCQNYSTIKFTNDMKNFILFYINRRRQKLAAGNERVRGGLHLPKPEIMMYVEWDRELAFLAQRLADQCNFIHDECRATVRYPYAGQTVGEVRWHKTGETESRGARRAIRRVLDAWWGERRRAVPHQLTESFRVAARLEILLLECKRQGPADGVNARGAVWGHFSQLCVWNLQAMGCGAVHYGSSHPRLLLVCDFSHTNMLGQRTYTPGPMAPCPVHTGRRPRTQFSLLCTPVRRPFPIEPETEEVYEDDEDFDPGLTLDVGEVPSPSVPYTRSTKRRTTRTIPVAFRDDIKTNNKGVLIDKLDHALDVRKKVVDKGSMIEDSSRWMTRPKTTSYGLWRNQEDFEVIPLRQTTPRPATRQYPGSYSTEQDQFDQGFSRLEEQYEPTVSTKASEEHLRQRWRQTSDRPIRPGAHALLISTEGRLSQRPRILSGVTLMLDKDDVEQLFRDTGFKMSSKSTKEFFTKNKVY